MQNQPILNIIVPLIGNVSAGKSTIINALFRDKFTEVSSKRRTAGVSFFRLSSSKKKVSEDDVNNDGSSKQKVPGEVEVIRTSTSVLEEIMADNICLRTGDDDGTVRDKVFNIELDEDLFEMRDNARLFLVDVPGLNEVGAKKYKDYIQSRWATFNCVIVVMDNQQDVNTDAQVALFQLIKSNIDTIKPVPVIILINKVDDVHDEDQMEMVQEFRKKVEQIFSVDDRKESLDRLLDYARMGTICPGEDALFPAVIPLCAMSAFIFRSCSCMSINEFRKLDAGTLAKLGRDTIGRLNWASLELDEKIDAAYKLVKDPKLYNDGIRGSNFDVFMDVLSYTIGGKERQLDMAAKQIMYSMKTIDFVGFSSQIRLINSVVEAFDSGDSKTVDSFSLEVRTKFWPMYNKEEQAAFSLFNLSPTGLEKIFLLAKELGEYCLLARDSGWTDEVEKAKTALANLVRKEISLLLKLRTSSNSVVFTFRVSGNQTWASFDEIAWYRIFGSILLLSHDKIFCEEFGDEKLLLDLVTSQMMDKIKDPFRGIINDVQCPQCQSISDFNRYCKSCNHYLLATFFPSPFPTSSGGSSFGSSNVGGVRPRGVRQSACSTITTFGVSNTSIPGGKYCCPHFMQCGGYIVYTSSVRVECKSGCSKSFYDLKNTNAADKVTMNCHKCNSSLDFNRYCRGCKIYYLPKNTIGNMQCCPRAPSHSSLTKKISEKEVTCAHCRTAFKELEKLPSEAVPLEELVANDKSIQVPRKFSDPKHFGNVAWIYCNLVANL